MTVCQRYAEEGLLLDERGEPLPEHFSTCPDCLAARASFTDLRGALAALGAEDEPPGDWQEQVRRRIRRGPSASRPFLRGPWTRLLAAAALAVAGLALALHWISISPAGPGPKAGQAAAPPLTLDIRIEAGAGTFRGEGEAQPGDLLFLAVPSAEGQVRELRLYLNDHHLVALCRGPEAAPPCFEDGGTFGLKLPLTAVGRYQGVALSSTEPLPEPASGVDADTAAALAAGAEIRLGEEIHVR